VVDFIAIGLVVFDQHLFDKIRAPGAVRITDLGAHVDA
jgi:hypothetical protein